MQLTPMHFRCIVEEAPFSCDCSQRPRGGRELGAASHCGSARWEPKLTLGMVPLERLEWQEDRNLGLPSPNML